MVDHGLSSVHAMTGSLQRLLDEAQAAKATNDLDPAITSTDLDRLTELQDHPFFAPSRQHEDADSSRQTHFARIETAVRNVFNSLLASTSIEDPSFSKMWILLDSVSIFSDREQCEPGLIFWLVEELLDSQTIEGCKKVFDYLESRRERITAKHFKQKNLIILRSCNELLRRLSRAENTVFCGRVFIFLFQSFPLGDKSSVNLRGEYHVENTTSFEDLSAKLRVAGEEMEVENEKEATGSHTPNKSQGPISEVDNSVVTVTSPPNQAEITADEPQHDGKGVEPNQPPGYDSLYPVFWSLQEYFSSPTKLFDATSLDTFKKGLNATMNNFKEVQKEVEDRGPLKCQEENKRGVKRKRGEEPDYMASNFNPKYLTSRDLFELEISDLAFRRHISVQALILLDFLLSLTSRAKAKLAVLTIQNKSVQYQYTLSEEDANWATESRSEIASYLQNGPEGKFYYRMVDTVLSRDKNWVRWKAESCPPIARPPVSPQAWVQAKNDAGKACAIRRLRAVPLDSLDLGFLSEKDTSHGWELLQRPGRYTVPEVESYQASIEEAENNLREATSEEAKELAINAKASKLWRALRLASKHRLTLFDKLDSFVQDLGPVYRTYEPHDEADEAGVQEVSEVNADISFKGTEEKGDPGTEIFRGPPQPELLQPMVQDGVIS